MFLSFFMWLHFNAMKVVMGKALVAHRQGILTEGKNQYSRPPFTNKFSSIAFHTETLLLVFFY
jgi:hypothetical protein